MNRKIFVFIAILFLILPLGSMTARANTGSTINNPVMEDNTLTVDSSTFATSNSIYNNPETENSIEYYYLDQIIRPEAWGKCGSPPAIVNNPSNMIGPPDEQGTELACFYPHQNAAVVGHINRDISTNGESVCVLAKLGPNAAGESGANKVSVYRDTFDDQNDPSGGTTWLPVGSAIVSAPSLGDYELYYIGEIYSGYNYLCVTVTTMDTTCPSGDVLIDAVITGSYLGEMGTPSIQVYSMVWTQGIWQADATDITVNDIPYTTCYDYGLSMWDLDYGNYTVCFPDETRYSGRPFYGLSNDTTFIRNSTIQVDYQGAPIYLFAWYCPYMNISNCGGGTTDISGRQIFMPYDIANVTATPDAGYQFAYWLFDDQFAGVNATFTYAMDTDNANHVLQAFFVLQGNYSLTVSAMNSFNHNDLVNTTVYIDDVFAGYSNTELFVSEGYHTVTLEAQVNNYVLYGIEGGEFCQTTVNIYIDTQNSPLTLCAYYYGL
jgi:hypothetical protein